MKVIIAEKPKLGRTIASALGCNKKQSGYIEGDNYFVTWAYGHLFTLKDIKDYDGLNDVSWEEISLPYFPEKFELKFSPDMEGREGEIEKQFNVIKKLVEREDVDQVIHCGDADREGQVIIDEILYQMNNKKPVVRLWLPEQTEESIRQQISVCESNKNYMNLYNEGLARSYIDWLLGINLTIYLSLKAKTTVRVGRVLIPIIRYIYDRDQMIANFIPQKYFQVESKTNKNDIPIILTVKKKYGTKKESDEYCNKLNKFKAKVLSINKKEIKKFPKPLFSLSKLQEELSGRHKMSFDKSLKIIQELYEEGFVTYPRTNTQYLSENEKDKVAELIKKINGTGYELKMKDTKAIFDSSKVESHSALIPTNKLPSSLSKEKEIVYRVIFNRFVSNFLAKETIVSETTMDISVGEEIFKLKGSEIISLGFYEFEPKTFKNQLPNLTEGETFEVKFVSIDKMTTVPKKVSETELSNFLEKPFKKIEIAELELDDNKEEANDDEDYKMMLKGIEIGTVATRTSIIQNAIRYNYITQKNSYYSTTPFSEKVIQLLDQLEVDLNKERNIAFSQMLKKIYHGMTTLEDSLSETWEVLNTIFEKDITPTVRFIETEKIGTCPKCKKGEVFEERPFYACNACDFKLWKKARYFKETFPISVKQAKEFLADKFVDVVISGKKKKKLKLKINGEYVNFEEQKEEIGICPKCGKEIREGEKNFYCVGYKEGCKFVLWKNAKYFKNTLKITKTIAKKLLKKDGYSVFEVTNKFGKSEKKNLKIKINGEYVNFEEVK